MTETVSISSTDVDDLAKLVYHEANSIKLYYQGTGMTEGDAMMLAYGSIIDIVINRVALASNTWGSDVQSVMDFHSTTGGVTTYQFTALQDHSVTTAHDLPSFTGYSDVRDFVDGYLTLRTMNGYIGDTGFHQNIVGPDTHYYNPTISSPDWGDDMGWGQSVGGGDDLHVMGIPRNADGSYAAAPQSYYLAYDGNTSELINPFGTPPFPSHKPDWSFTPPPLFDLPDPILLNIQPAFATAVSAASPLVIDLSSSHTGVTLTTWSAASTDTFFDLNNNGFAVQTAWVSGDTGLLARDINENGMIDSSAELFGSPTIDGFAKLAALDSNHDLRIDNNDAAWGSLVVWVDNGDAVSQQGELQTLSSLNIESIDLAGVATSSSTISGNHISHTSTVRFTGGATAAIDDAWFVHDNTDSYYVGDYTLDSQTLFLPELRGYGTLPDLAIAMSQDSDLKDMVSDFVDGFSLANIADATATITDILYKWAAVDGVSSSSRGPYVDAQHLGFLEKLVGTEFLQYGLNPIPLGNAGTVLEQAYHSAFDMLSADLMMQTGAASLFAGTVTYNASTGSFDGDLSLSHDAIDDLVGIAPAAGPDNVAFWVAVGQLLEGVKGLDNLTGDELGWLENAVNASDPLLHWTNTATIVAEEIQGSGTDDTLNGDSGPNVIHGNGGNDIINGGGGNDTLYGDDGNDTVYGSTGNDTIYGGNGNDDLHGAYGNDTYYAGTGGNTIDSRTGNDTFYYGGGDDVITEYGGTDQIILPSGIVLGDLTFSRVSSDNSTSYFDDLLIQIDGSGSIQIRSHFYTGGSLAVETLVFSDTSTLSLTSLAPDVLLSSGNDNFSASTNASYTVYGFDGNDSIYTAGTGAHTIDGGNGNDSMQGGTGSDDTYIASAGFDTISENGGTDTIVIPAAYDPSDVSFYRIGTYDLGILINGLGEIKVNSQFTYYEAVENLHFNSDNSNVDLTAISVASLGTSGNDTMTAPSYHTNSNDFMDGREGNDSLSGGNGDDTYVFSAGHDVVADTGGDDTIRVRESYSPEDITVLFNSDPYNAGLDRGIILTDTDGNTLIVSDQTYHTYNMIDHIAFGDSTVWDLSSLEIETHGTSGADYLYGHDIGDASSADTIYGYDGADNIYGGNGNDVIYGGNGDDFIYASGSDGSDTVHGDAGADTLYGVGNSVLYGDDGSDTLYNNASSFNAGSTAMTLNGGDGADYLWGGYGQTTMDGGNGADTLYGGSGHDIFTFDAATAFNAVDTVQYFNSGSGDKIDISDILDGHYNPGTDVITNFVQIQTNGSNSELYVDTTGTATFGSAEHIATIQGVTGLTDEAALVTAGTLLAA